MWLIDLCMNWLLWLPLDVVLAIVALGTALILTLVRLKTTNQDLLRRCSDDKKTLKSLIRAAKRSGDKEAIARYRASIGQIGLKTLRAEFLPLVVSLVPIAALAIWSYAHLGFHPPAAKEPLVVKAWFTPGAIGEPAILVPEDGVKLAFGKDASVGNSSWIRRIDADRGEMHSSPSTLLSRPAGDVDLRSTAPTQTTAVPRGVASWAIVADASSEPRQLTVRHRGKSYELLTLIGQRDYLPPEATFDGAPLRKLEVVLRPYRPFGIVPGFAPLGLDPWLIGYLLLAIPAAFAFRAIFRVC